VCIRDVCGDYVVVKAVFKFWFAHLS
jgi:hypothetical protein